MTALSPCPPSGGGREKRCTRCQLIQPITQFRARSDRPGKHYGQCMDCESLLKGRKSRRAWPAPKFYAPLPFSWWPVEDRRAVL